MNLNNALEGKEYIIRHLETEDEELDTLFILCSKYLWRIL